jgi:hypothetical protein
MSRFKSSDSEKEDNTSTTGRYLCVVAFFDGIKTYSSGDTYTGTDTSRLLTKKYIKEVN